MRIFKNLGRKSKNTSKRCNTKNNRMK